MRTTLAMLFVGALSFALARSASANAPAPFSRPTGAVPGVVVERPSPVVVEREELVIDCARQPEVLHPACSFTATYYLANPTADDEELAGAFYTVVRARRAGDAAGGVHASAGGASVEGTLTDDQMERLDAIVKEDPEILALASGEDAPGFGRAPFHVVVAAGRRVELVFEGPLEPLRFYDDSPQEGYAFPPLYTRHVFGASSRAAAWTRSEEDYLYLVSPITRWAGDPEVRVQIRHHRANDLLLTSPSRSRSRARVEAGRDGDVVVESAVLRASSKQNLRFSLHYDPPLVKNGGPVFGIGPRIAREELRVKLGYEVGIGSSALLGASAETNFDEYLTSALALDVGSPSFVGIIPSLSVGGGVPVQLRRGAEPRVGARLQLGISWALLSLSFPIDYYPAPNSSGSHFEGAFLTQLSF